MSYPHDDIYGDDGDDYDRRDRRPDPSRSSYNSRGGPPQHSSSNQGQQSSSFGAGSRGQSSSTSHRQHSPQQSTQPSYGGNGTGRGAPIALFASNQPAERYAGPTGFHGGQGPPTALTWNDLHWYTSDADMKVACATAGVQIAFTDVCFMEHKVNGKSKGTVYIDFRSPQDAETVRAWFENNEFQGKYVVPDLGPSQGKNPFATLPKDAHRVASGRGGRGGGRGGFNQRGGAPSGGGGGMPSLPTLPGQQQLPQYGAPIHMGGANTSMGNFGGAGNVYGAAMTNPAMYMAMMQQQAQAMYAQQAAAQQQQQQQPPAKRHRED